MLKCMMVHAKWSFCPAKIRIKAVCRGKKKNKMLLLAIFLHFFMVVGIFFVPLRAKIADTGKNRPQKAQLHAYKL